MTPQTRSQMPEDNRSAASRRSPNGGLYGPDACNQGYAWREAFPNDHVCVPSQTRAQAAEDNCLVVSHHAP